MAARRILSISDLRALSGCLQRNGGALSPTRAARLILLGMVYYREDVAECYPDRAPSYSPTPLGWRAIKSRGLEAETSPATLAATQRMLTSRHA